MDKDKFKLWNKEKNRWFDDKKDRRVFADPKGILIQCQMNLEKLLFEFIDVTDKYIKLDCTGLKDKNGKLICEGDIVELPYIDPMGGIHWDYLGKNSKFAIGYEFGNYIILNPPFDNRNIREMLQKEKGEYISNYGNLTVLKDIVECMVIGNVYENPELLGDNK